MLNGFSRCTGTAVRALVLGAGLLLAACGSSAPMWIGGPLLADGSGSNTPGEPYQGQAEHLHVGPEDWADFGFSLATLPNGAMHKIDISGGTATRLPSTYNLTSAKVYSARLVLYVESVEQPGYLRIDGRYSDAGDCFANEAQAPTCTQVFGGSPIAADADNPAQALRITERGYYSFDVTPLVRHRVALGYTGILRVNAAMDPANGSVGRFGFASKELGAARFAASRRPQLLVTLTDAAGFQQIARVTTSVQNVLDDPSVANRDFSMDDDMLMDGAPAERAFGLVSQYRLPVAARAILDQIGTRDYKLTLSTSLNSGFPSQPGVDPKIDWYRIPDFNNGGARITWNDGWSVPGTGARLATTPLRSHLASQVLTADIGRGYADAIVAAYTASTSAVDFAVAGTTSVQGPVMLDGRRQTGAGMVPEFSLVISPVPVHSFYALDVNDDSFAIDICVYIWDEQSTCEVEPLQLRARIGQRFALPAIFVLPRATASGSTRAFASQLNIAVPTEGPSVDLDTDPAPINQVLDGGVGVGNPVGYQIGLRETNREVGSYTGVISLVGHNARSELHFENLPLPVPSLSGPARVTIPAGAGSLTLPVDAAQPFVLAVDDAIVNANIDDTTKWLFTSSDPADTMPSEVQQTNGSIALPITFGSAGARTITVTSKGDASVTATLDIVVDAQGTTVLASQGPAAVYGQPIALSAQVDDHAGAPVSVGAVEFMRGAEVLGSAPVVGGVATLVVSDLDVGVHLLFARHGGDPGSFIAASESDPEGFAVDQATVALSIVAPASIFVGESVDVGVELAVVAPGAGTPSGTVIIDDGTDSCEIDLASANGCTLAPAGAGPRMLLASYSGDAHFLESMASAPLDVLERAVLAPALDDGSAFARYGQVVDYAFTLRNDGLGAAASIAIDVTLSAAFDGAAAVWQCFGAGDGASCAASGSGPLHDVATIPPGRTLTWVVSVPVRADAAEGEATLTFAVGGPDPHVVADTDTLVLLRDGFEAAQEVAISVTGDEADQVIDGEAVQVFELPPASGRRFETVLALRGRHDTIAVLRTWLDAATALVRLSARDAGGERASPWARADAGATLAVTGLKPEQGAPVVLLEGSVPPLATGN